MSIPQLTTAFQTLRLDTPAPNPFPSPSPQQLLDKRITQAVLTNDQKDGKTLLSLALWNHDITTIQYLSPLGINPSSLTLADAMEDPTIAEEIRRRQFIPTHVRGPISLLALAILTGNTTLIDAFREAQVNFNDPLLFTNLPPLKYAFLANCPDSTIHSLLQAKADPTFIDSEGYSIPTYARLCGYDHLLPAIERAGGTLQESRDFLLLKQLVTIWGLKGNTQHPSTPGSQVTIPLEGFFSGPYLHRQFLRFFDFFVLRHKFAIAIAQNWIKIHFAELERFDFVLVFV